MKKRNILINLVILLLAGMLISCSSTETEDASAGNSVSSSQDTLAGDISVGAEEDIASDEETQDEIQNNIVINTSYGDMYYPEQWEEFIRTTQETSGDAIVVKFETEIDDNNYELFHVIINGEEGTSVGTITDSDGVSWTVSVEMNELSDISELTEGEQNRLYAMQEDINYLIDNLK